MEEKALEEAYKELGTKNSRRDLDGGTLRLLGLKIHDHSENWKDQYYALKYTCSSIQIYYLRYSDLCLQSKTRCRVTELSQF